MAQNKQTTDAELEQLGTHAFAATNTFQGRETQQKVQIDAPKVPNPGPYDTRTGFYE